MHQQDDFTGAIAPFRNRSFLYMGWVAMRGMGPPCRSQDCDRLDAATLFSHLVNLKKYATVTGGYKTIVSYSNFYMTKFFRPVPSETSRDLNIYSSCYTISLWPFVYCLG